MIWTVFDQPLVADRGPQRDEQRREMLGSWVRDRRRRTLVLEVEDSVDVQGGQCLGRPEVELLGPGWWSHIARLAQHYRSLRILAV